MPRSCSICSHHQKQAIEATLHAGESLRIVSKRLGVSIAALYRHKISHMRDDVPNCRAEREEQETEIADVSKQPVVTEHPVDRRIRRPLRQKPVVSERIVLVDGRPGPCPACGANSWRLLGDGSLSCALCHPLPGRW